ncbi:UPF0415 protein C7orf25 homolog [Asterias rubens]|uniref:UPF0415 protein C7orf25 homolog n=1 Tax=Asterias rubens TaxID=7604 RepID=UPI001455293F|nr:UPF0415 protein C7orf25 homolog [Asterias rubens]
MDESTQEALQRLLIRAQGLLARAQILQAKEAGISGIGKLIKKVQSELTFVKSLKDGTIALKENQLKSTNLSHLEGIIHSIESFGHVISVLHPFHFEGCHGNENTVIVDVVGHGGASWVKITARKAKALHRIWEGEGEYGEHDIVEQAEQYLQASHQHPLNYNPPTVNVVFYGGVTKAIVDDLDELGIRSHGHVFASIGESENYPLQLPTIATPEVPTNASLLGNGERPKVNLDVTTLVALVSDLTHGGCWHAFQEPLIQELADQERDRPLVTEVEQFLKDKDLYACQTAITDFRNILHTIAGPREKERAQALLERISVIDDEPTERAAVMEESHRIKHRAKVIFGTGDKIKAVTITANVGFVRAAINRGVTFAVHIHQSRALTEKKQNSALIGKANSQPPTEDAVCDKLSAQLTEQESIRSECGTEDGAGAPPYAPPVVSSLQSRAESIST